MIWTGFIILVMILVLLVPISKPCQILITKKTIHSSKKELFFYAKAKLYDCFTSEKMVSLQRIDDIHLRH
ncbi:MAG TPA: hypothetical protein DEQ31_00945 [Exiguobacterium sp.]|nr:hypothetical protein [Exiguobacterium sp.]